MVKKQQENIIMQTKEQQETQVILTMADRLSKLEKAVEDIAHLYKMSDEKSHIQIREILQKIRKNC